MLWLPGTLAVCCRGLSVVDTRHYVDEHKEEVVGPVNP